MCAKSVHTTRMMKFEEVMLVVQVSIENYEIMDVLLDGRFGVNIIFEHMQRKLSLKKP
jgi:hypothetical protein